MATTVHTCYTIDCDQCRKPIHIDDNEHDYTPHFTTPDEARSKLRGDPDDEESVGYLDGAHHDGQDLCGTCLARRLCPERGHEWSPWLDCCCRTPYGGGTREPLKGHEDGCPQWRYCERHGCNAHGERPVPVAVTVEG